MINSNQIALLELLKATLFHITPHFPEDTNWNEVLLEAKSHAVLALAAPSVPKEEADKWKSYVYQNTAHYMQVLFCQKQLIRLFDIAGIPLVILKGTAAAIYYPNPIQRSMGDIDFIVPKDRFDGAYELMRNSGYVVDHGDSEDDRHICFTKDGVNFEMHRYFGSYGIDIEFAIIEGYKQRQNMRVLNCEFPILPTIENGLVLLAHIRHHLVRGDFGIGLRQVIDWMMYVHANVSVDGWKDSFIIAAHQYKLDTLAAVLTTICKKRLGLSEEIVWDADEATAEDLFDRIMANGNFNSKKDRSELRDKPVQLATQNLRRMGLKYLQMAGKNNWKVAQRIWILKPFAWLYQIFRYIIKGLGRVKTGKRLIKEVSDGNKNSDLFRRLGI